MLSSDDFGKKDKVRPDDTYAIYNEAEWNEFKSMIEGYFYGNGHWIQYDGCGLFAHGLNATVENLGIIANLLVILNGLKWNKKLQKNGIKRRKERTRGWV